MQEGGPWGRVQVLAILIDPVHYRWAALRYPSCNPSPEGQVPPGNPWTRCSLKGVDFPEKDSKTLHFRLGGEFLLFQGLRDCPLDLKLACILWTSGLFGKKQVTDLGHIVLGCIMLQQPGPRAQSTCPPGISWPFRLLMRT